MRREIKYYASAYWEYVILYVDCALCISINAENVLKNKIVKYFLIKLGSDGYPNIYLGNMVSKVTLHNVVEAWSLSSSQYVQNSAFNVETYLKKLDMKVPKKDPTSFASGYRPELDITPDMDAKEAAYYQSLIGILKCILNLVGWILQSKHHSYIHAL